MPFQNTVDNEDEAYLYHLRAIDSLFPDIENFLFRVILSDDDTVESQYWYVSMRHCMKAVFALSADIDYVVSRILGKVIEGILVHVDNYFPKLLKRAMTLDEKASEELEEAVEPYADFNKDHSATEMDFAYREGLFARTVTSIAKSKAEGGDITSAELSSDLEKPADKVVNELGEEDSNRPSTEELIRTRTQALLQTRLLHKSGVVGHSLALVVFFVRCPGIPDGIRNAALRTFSKFLLICPQLTEEASPTLFTFICSHPDPQMREYLLAAGVDVMHRFPTMLENRCLFLYEMPMDADPCPRGTLSDAALCLLNRKRADANSEDSTNDEREVAALAMALFRELSRKASSSICLRFSLLPTPLCTTLPRKEIGNLLVNVLPDLICRICRWEEQVPLDAFKHLVRQLLPLVDGKPLDIVVEKMCQRFQFCSSGEAIEHNKNIAYYFSYLISQLTLSDTSVYKDIYLQMRDTLPYFAQFLEDGIIFHDFKAVISQLISNTQSTAVKHDAEELLRKMEFLHLRSSLTEEERNVMSRTVGPINLAVPIKVTVLIIDKKLY
uniref:Non-specific serine/threonine protein kinase n=1 Tax=Angiostrongylus cantonensis TaxID=6313 RepID=A0A0K0D437_ANGCA